MQDDEALLALELDRITETPTHVVIPELVVVVDGKAILSILAEAGLCCVATLVVSEELEERLTGTLGEGRWNVERLVEMADTYGTKATLALVERGLGVVEAAA